MGCPITILSKVILLCSATLVSVLRFHFQFISQKSNWQNLSPTEKEQITLEARYFTASSLGLWFSGVSEPDPGGDLAALVPLVEALGESNGVKGRSWEASEAAAKRPVSLFTARTGVDIKHLSWWDPRVF